MFTSHPALLKLNKYVEIHKCSIFTVILGTQSVTFTVTSKYLHTGSTTGKMLGMFCIITLLKMLLSNSHCALFDLQSVFVDDKHRKYMTKTDTYGF